MFQPRSPFPIVCAALALLTALPMFGQTRFGPPSGGTISGTVRNASGDTMPGATITIINQETGVTRVARSGANGAYSVTGLGPGLYAVSADLPGIGKATERNRRLAAEGTLTVDLTLEVRVSEEVTVTATKREETIHNIPFSVAAPTEDVLRERGVENVEQVAANVASFTVQNLGPGQSQIAIRGVSSGQIARDQPGVKESVGVYLDESVISLSLFTPDLDLFDLSRVEVLRGSQGTLFGSGSLGGTVRYITNQPELGATRVFGELTGSTISGGNQGGNIKAGFNAPLGDTAALRVVGFYDRLAGWMDAVQPDLSVKKNVNTGDRYGFRASVQIAPNDRLTLTPRFVYQKVEMDGWNRIDIYNILANPFTTTRPQVTLGDRKLFTQINEPFTDKFYLGDLTAKYNFGNVVLTSITSYTNRDILVVRDATALTGSITGGSIGLPANIYTLNAPLDDATKAKAWTEELRLSGGQDRFFWILGGFYADSKRDYGQNLLVTGFEDTAAADGLPPSTWGPMGTRGLRAPKDSLFFSDLHYHLKQYAAFAEATFAATDRLKLTGGLRYYHFDENKDQIFDGIFAQDNTGISLVSQPGSTSANGVAPRLIATYKATDATNLNVQIAKGFRLGGINDPLNVPLCTPQDLVTFGGRESWKDETAWNYEIGSKSRIMGGRGSFNVSAFYVDIRDLQVTVTAGSCSSRLIFNVPKARSVGAELEFAAAPDNHFDFAVSAGYNDSTLRSTVTSTDAMGNVSVVSGIQSGERLPSVPKFQAALAATYQTPITPEVRGYLTGNYTHVGSRFTQVGDDQLGVLDLNSFAPHTIGGPLTQSTFTYNPELPAYDIVNLRLGARFSNFDVALFANNVTDERAFLALDRERGTRARIGYLTNQPRTFGITTRLDF
ncbi:MAG TPA: TonB-dependent receptor [Thermoanaerobaculia bacterium]